MRSPSSPASIAAGKAAFQKNCRFCHGAEAKGNGPMAPEGTHPSDLTDDKWDRGSTDGEIFAVIRDGAGPKFDMKGYKSKMTEQGNLERGELPPEPAGEVDALGSSLLCVVGAVGMRRSAPGASVPSETLFTPAHRTMGQAARAFFGDPVEGRAADSIPAQDAHRQEGGVRRLPRERRKRSDRRHPEREDLDDLSQPDRDRSPAHQRGHRAIRTKGIEIPWQRVYGFTRESHVRFNHAPHIRASVACTTCHGDVAKQTVAERSVDHSMGFW